MGEPARGHARPVLLDPALLALAAACVLAVPVFMSGLAGVRTSWVGQALLWLIFAFGLFVLACLPFAYEGTKAEFRRPSPPGIAASPSWACTARCSSSSLAASAMAVTWPRPLPWAPMLAMSAQPH